MSHEDVDNGGSHSGWASFAGKFSVGALLESVHGKQLEKGGFVTHVSRRLGGLHGATRTRLLANR